jgi:DUF971 family protein
MGRSLLREVACVDRMFSMSVVPTSLRALKDVGMLEIMWSDGATYRLPFKLVRVECPCAQCIHEITGERIVRPEVIPDDIHPTELGYSGNYALRIVWSDGHASGIFTWERLRGICSHLQAVRVA